ncbi:hypothetical protein [Chitinimonas sp. BJB300]|uniref:hypothetical protein n=1 Tax=Chitinimonas sp. BJB300 TaxID=1559339 RepID=UPI000C0FE4A9|nr:hypothetical protein [Chitinimonas sp. BJB300]PHV10539.1 hypothetical protein CSQ89_15615 [Chitinimonas sp. BJB300]TSJ91404.1 hypothetical protein FG002_003725 [Chitinimonas sp. BJB300]
MSKNTVANFAGLASTSLAAYAKLSRNNVIVSDLMKEKDGANFTAVQADDFDKKLMLRSSCEKQL